MQYSAALLALFSALLPLVAQSTHIKPIAPGVWFRTGAPLVLPNGADITENTMIIEMKDYVVVIDSGTRNTARDTIADCRALSTKPVKYVFLTHHHFDHVEGNALWTEAGAITLAFPGVTDMLQAENRGYQLPKQTIEGDTMVLEDSTRRLEFHYFGWAHTKGDGVAYLPKEHILCTGDIAVNGPFNSVFNSQLRNWPNVLRRLEAFNPQSVLPGHGAPATKDMLTGQREYLESLIAQVQKAVTEGRKPEELVEMKNGKPGPSRLQHPPAVSKWAFSPFSGKQVLDAYKLLAQ